MSFKLLLIDFPFNRATRFIFFMAFIRFRGSCWRARLHLFAKIFKVDSTVLQRIDEETDQGQLVGDVLEIPHLANYGSHVPPADSELWLNLAKRHLRACAREQAPFISSAYYTGLRCSGDPDEWQDTGFHIYEQILATARGEFGAQFVKLSTIADAALAKPKAWQQRDEYKR